MKYFDEIHDKTMEQLNDVNQRKLLEEELKYFKQTAPVAYRLDGFMKRLLIKLKIKKL